MQKVGICAGLFPVKRESGEALQVRLLEHFRSVILSLRRIFALKPAVLLKH